MKNKKILIAAAVVIIAIMIVIGFIITRKSTYKKLIENAESLGNTLTEGTFTGGIKNSYTDKSTNAEVVIYQYKNSNYAKNDMKSAARLMKKIDSKTAKELNISYTASANDEELTLNAIKEAKTYTAVSRINDSIVMIHLNVKDKVDEAELTTKLNKLMENITKGI